MIKIFLLSSRLLMITHLLQVLVKKPIFSILFSKLVLNARLAFNEFFQNKLESVQYNAALAITGAIRDSSREKLYREFDLESLKSRRRYPKLCLFFKLKKMNIPLTPLIFFQSFVNTGYHKP